jgi:hypothetical protein
MTREYDLTLIKNHLKLMYRTENFSAIYILKEKTDNIIIKSLKNVNNLRIIWMRKHETFLPPYTRHNMIAFTSNRLKIFMCRLVSSDVINYFSKWMKLWKRNVSFCVRT